jgi:hypothetical protein
MQADCVVNGGWMVSTGCSARRLCFCRDGLRLGLRCAYGQKGSARVS